MDYIYQKYGTNKGYVPRSYVEFELLVSEKEAKEIVRDFFNCNSVPSFLLLTDLALICDQHL